ncbi:MAG TPA: oligosaccharide flippase family protein [Planctomycetota bacterium]
MASIVRNTAYLTVAKTLNVAIYALLGLVLPRFVSTETNGVYSLVSNLLFFGSVASSFGIPIVFVRSVALDRTRARTLFVDARTAMGAGALLAGALMVVYVMVEMSYQGGWEPLRLHLVLMATGILFADALGTVGESLFQAYEEMEVPAIAETITGVFRGGGAVLALWWLGADEAARGTDPLAGRAALYGVFAVFLAGSLVRGVLIPELARRRYFADRSEPLPRPSFRRAWALLRECFGVALFRMLRMIRNRIDVQLLGILIVPVAGLGLMETADDARGLYAQAFRVVIVFHTLTMAVNTAIFPRIARLSDPGGPVAELRAQFFRVVRHQAWWAAPLAAVTFVYADHVAGWFGAEYRDGIPGLGSSTDVLRLLAISMVLDAVGGPVGMVLLGQPSMNRFLPWFGGALAAVSVVLNFWLIPRYGILGAAYASVGASVIEFIAKALLTQRFLGRSLPLLTRSAPAVGLAVLFGYALEIGPLAERPLLGGSVAAVAWLVVTPLLRIADPALARGVRRKLRLGPRGG